MFGGGVVLVFGRIKTGGRMVYSCGLMETLASPRLRGDEANISRRCGIG